MRLLRAEPEPALAAVFEFLGLGVNGGLAPDALARIARADAVDPESENGFNRERLAGGSGWLGVSASTATSRRHRWWWRGAARSSRLLRPRH